MRTYRLTSPPASNDAAPAFVQRAMTWAKATNEIAGLIRGLLADGTVTTAEAIFLRSWVHDHPELLSDPLVAALRDRLERIFADGIVTPEELEELKQCCSEFIPQDHAPTTLPLDTPPPAVVIPNRAFCFTGTFISGKRSWCELQITTRGGSAHESVLSDTNYLVIGTKVSAAWANQSYGRKIEHAMISKQRGCPISIINEEHWIKALA